MPEQSRVPNDVRTRTVAGPPARHLSYPGFPRRAAVGEQA